MMPDAECCSPTCELVRALFRSLRMIPSTLPCVPHRLCGHVLEGDEQPAGAYRAATALHHVLIP